MINVANPWTYVILAVVALLIFATGYASGSIATTGKATEAALKSQATQFEVDRKADQAASAKNIQAAVSAMAAQSNADAQLREQREISLSILERVNRAPRSANCINSPAIRTYVDGLRKRTAN